MSFRCSLCDYKTNDQSNYKKHLKTQKHQKNEEECTKKEEECTKNEEECTKNEEETTMFELISTINTNYHSCQWCKRNFARSDNLQRHLQSCKSKVIFSNTQIIPELSHTTNEIKCQKCLMIFKFKSGLSRHKKKCYFKNEIDDQQKDKEIEQLKIEIKQLKYEQKKDLKGKNNKCPQVSTSDPSFICLYCNNKYLNSRSLNKHMYTCGKRKLDIQKIENEKNLLKLENEKERAINHERNLRIAEQTKAIEMAKQSTIVNIHNTQNKTINFLNTQYGDMIAMETFLKALENTHQLTLQERQDLLNAYYECGIDVFARNFSYIMKENCKRQLEAQGLKDMKLLPLFCSDGNLRSHKEKQLDGWKTLYDNQSINKMLNISNQQIHQSYQKVVPISGRERNRVYNEIKKDNHQNKLMDFKE